MHRRLGLRRRGNSRPLARRRARRHGSQRHRRRTARGTRTRAARLRHLLPAPGVPRLAAHSVPTARPPRTYPPAPYTPSPRLARPARLRRHSRPRAAPRPAALRHRTEAAHSPRRHGARHVPHDPAAPSPVALGRPDNRRQRGHQAAARQPRRRVGGQHRRHPQRHRHRPLQSGGHGEREVRHGRGVLPLPAHNFRQPT